MVSGLNSTTTPQEKTCHGCGGKGWVEVGREEPVFIPKPDNPYPYPTIPFPKPWDRIEVWWA